MTGDAARNYCLGLSESGLIPERMAFDCSDFSHEPRGGSAMMKMHYNPEFAETLRIVSETSEFKSAFEDISYQFIYDAFFFNDSLAADFKREIFDALCSIVSIFAALRVHRDGVSPTVAFSRVLYSKGICCARLFPLTIKST